MSDWAFMRQRLCLAAIAAVTVGITPALARQVIRTGVGPMEVVREPAALRLTAPISRWDDALPLGNGTIGALVWGTDNLLRVSLDRGDLWDERLPAPLTGKDWNYATLRKLVGDGDEAKLHEMFDAPYESSAYPTKLPVGRFELVFPEDVKARGFELSLGAGEITAGYTPARVRVHVLSTGNLIYVRVDKGRPEMRLVPAAGVAKLGYEPAKVGTDTGEVWFEQAAGPALKYAVSVRERRDDEGGTDFAIAIVSTRDNPDPLLGARNATIFPSDYDYDEYVEQQHYQRWIQFWKGSKVKLPDKRFQAQYELAKYLYGAGSRIG